MGHARVDGGQVSTAGRGGHGQNQQMDLFAKPRTRPRRPRCLYHSLVTDTVPNGRCLEWKWAQNGYGYGQFKMNNQYFRAHRFFWERAYGPIPPGLDLDHVCRNRLCVNPPHLEPVTRSENLHRGNTGAVAIYPKVKTCPICGVDFQTHVDRRSRQKACGVVCGKKLAPLMRRRRRDERQAVS